MGIAQHARTFTQCWYNVGSASATLAQHCTNIGWMSRACWEIFRCVIGQWTVHPTHQFGWRTSPLALNLPRLVRLSDSDTASSAVSKSRNGGQALVPDFGSALNQRWVIVADHGYTIQPVLPGNAIGRLRTVFHMQEKTLTEIYRMCVNYIY